MIDNQRLVMVVEGGNPQNMDSVVKRCHPDRLIDEIRLITPKNQPAIKGMALHWKHRDVRIRNYQEDMVRHLVRRCQEPDTLYVVIGANICWVSPESISQAAMAHHRCQDHFVTFMALAAADRTGYLMQVMGILPDALLKPWHANYLSTYTLDHPVIQQEAHEQIIYCAKSNQMHRLDFGRWIMDARSPVHSNAFCFRGEEWAAATFFVKTSTVKSANELATQVSHAALADSEKCNAICGAAWCAADNERTQGVRHRYLHEVDYVAV